MFTSYIGFGSNIDNRENFIIEALTRLSVLEGIQLKSISGLYETEPVGYIDQNDFLNGVVCVETTKTPAELLAACLQVEEKLGRMRTFRWGPRTIDLDILLFDDLVQQIIELTIPHRELANRRFVLEPLAEIAPEVVVPIYELTVRQLLSKTKDTSRVLMVTKSVELLSKIKKV